MASTAFPKAMYYSTPVTGYEAWVEWSDRSPSGNIILACASVTVLSTDCDGSGGVAGFRITCTDGDFSSTDRVGAMVGYRSGSPPKQTVVVDLGDNRMNPRFSRPRMSACAFAHHGVSRSGH